MCSFVEALTDVARTTEVLVQPYHGPTGSATAMGGGRRVPFTGSRTWLRLQTLLKLASYAHAMHIRLKKFNNQVNIIANVGQ